jgi:hypothetical protein
MILSIFQLVGIPRLPLFLHELPPRSKCEPLLDESVILLCGHERKKIRSELKIENGDKPSINPSPDFLVRVSLCSISTL